MKTFNKLTLSILGCALVLLGSGGNSAPQNVESAVSIDPFTGFVEVKIFPAPSVTLSANPATVTVNVATSISWSAPNFGGNLNCTRTSTPVLNGWNTTSNVVSGSASVTMPAQAQTVTLTLSCTGDNGSASNSTNVTVTPSMANCTTRPPSYNGSPRVLVSRLFSDAWNLPFPGSVGQGAFNGGAIGIQHGTVSAFEFVAPLASVVPFDGYLQLVLNPDRGGRGTLVAGFSECPGEINNQTIYCEGDTSKPRSDWTVKTPPTANRCPLVPGRTYYYNISVSNAGCTFDSGATGAECGYRLESKQYF